MRGSIKSFTGLLFFSILVISSSGCQPQVEPVTPSAVTPGVLISVLGQREYSVSLTLDLSNEGPVSPDKQNLWVALIQDYPPYQNVRSMEISPSDFELVVDEYGNQYAEFDLSRHPKGTTRTIEIDYQVVVNELTYDLTVCQGELLGEFLQPEVHIESANPQIKALASHLAQDKDNVCQQVRAFYDHVSSELVYTINGANWGAQAALGYMGSDCTEYSALLVALSRAEGIPARYFEGLLYLDQGADAGVKIEHAWPDVYLPNIGWVAMDPTLGRIPANRETYFAHYTPDHIIITQGASPSVLRGSSYWTHLYWPGDSTKIDVEGEWKIELVQDGH